MNQKTLLYLALGLLAMRWFVREPRLEVETDLVTRLRLAGAL
jgi:hypothetical protein